MADSRYNRMNNQAPAQTQLEASSPNVGRSAFDFSCIHSGNTMFGLVAPVDCFDFVPNEDIDIDISALVELRNPLLRNILNGSRVYFHCYINYLVDLWEGAKNFLDAGRSGRISLKRPNLIYRIDEFSYDDDRKSKTNACTPMSLLNFLGLPAQAIEVKSDGSSMALPLYQFTRTVDTVDEEGNANLRAKELSKAPDFFPADCCMAYQRNWRDFYSNENLLQNNKFWFPDNEDHFILSYSCEEAVCIKYEDEDYHSITDPQAPLSKIQAQAVNIIGHGISFADMSDEVDDTYGWVNRDGNNRFTPEPNNPHTVFASEDWKEPQYNPNLAGIKFRQFKGDRFTTALPFPDLIRGDIPVLADTGDVSNGRLLTDIDTGEDPDVIIDGKGYKYVNAITSDIRTGYASRAFLNTPEGNFKNEDSENTLRVKVSSAITMNDIRALETMTVFKERMARTSGEYNDMIEAQYGYNPHHHIRRGEYVGGFYQDFAFSSVVQTSESGSTPLGSKAGQGVSNGQGRIGHVHTRDFGWLQIYMSIVPDVMYTQGVPRMFSKDTQEKMYFPIFNNLAPQAIQNKELVVTGNPAVDNDVFAYEDRYAEYKSRPNRVSGFMSLSPSVARFDSSKIMARRFGSNEPPALNNQFVTLLPENVDMNVFSVNNEPPFDFQVGIKVRRVFPGPYTAVPGSLSSGLHA